MLGRYRGQNASAKIRSKRGNASGFVPITKLSSEWDSFAVDTFGGLGTHSASSAPAIVSVSPVDGNLSVPVGADLVITFNENVVKGQGAIHVVRETQGTLGVAVDVRSSNVTVTGKTVTIDLPTNLEFETNYFVLIDSGTFLDTTTTLNSGATLLTQNFDLLPLGPFIQETGGDGTDFTLTPPIGFTIDNSQMATGGRPEWSGWSFANKAAWAQVDDQNRSDFLLGKNTIAVADTDEFDDVANSGNFVSFLQTRPIELSGVTANTVVLEFDSSFRPENSQVGKLDVRFNGGAWTNLLTLDPTNTSNGNRSEGSQNINEHLISGTRTKVSTGGLGNADFKSVNNPSSGTMEFRFGVEGKNDWWWALDELKVTGQVAGAPFPGVTDPTAWNFRTPEAPKLTLTIDKTAMSENGGTATGTVARNLSTTDPLVITLSSSDTTEATVPVTVTIPAGQASTTFTITAVDDSLSDRTQNVQISASASGFLSSQKSIDVLDDEGAKIVTLNPADNATSVDVKSNFTMTLDTNVRKGSGYIHFVRASDNKLGFSIDVNNPAVSISGASITIDPPSDLLGLTNYYILIDDGAFIDTSSTATPGTQLLGQNFELLPLGPFVTRSGGDGTDFTKTAPLGFTVENSVATGGIPEWEGWSFADKGAWITAAGTSPADVAEGRGLFARGVGTIAVADPGEWAEATPAPSGGFTSFLRTSPINLTGIQANSVVIEFDSSFRSSLPQIGNLDVSFDGGTSWANILVLDDGSPLSVRNERRTISVANPSSGSLVFRFGILNAGDHYWWAIDNLKVTGQVTGVPFAGIDNPTVWNFTTREAPALVVTIDKLAISETGTAVGTVTRNLETTEPLVVSLVSNDTTEATVPATVTIPAGAASANFTITAVDDGIVDDTQTVLISASATGFFSGSRTILVTEAPLIVSLSVPDNATNVPASTDFQVTFNQTVKKGNGFVHFIRSSDNKLGLSVDIQSANVTIAGAVVTINPPVDLVGSTNYYVLFDDGAILGTVGTVRNGASLLTQNFELLPLLPAPFETVGVNGRDYTTTPPLGFSVDNSLMPPGGVPEWNGWTFARKDFWSTQGGQNRSRFTRGTGTIAVADTDEWDDTSTLNNSFNSVLRTTRIQLGDVAANSAVLEFDSSFRPEDSQIGKLDVSFNGGTTWTNLLELNPTNTTDLGDVDLRKSIPISNPASGTMEFRFGVTGANDWWWALDNLSVKGNVTGLPFFGISDPTTWNFTTAESAALTLTLNPASISENGGTSTATLSRNLSTTDALVVSLNSNDTSEATVPASVTIPAGQSSVTFQIAAVDDLVADGLRNVSLSAKATGYVDAIGTIGISDNEVIDMIVSEIMYNPAGSEPRTEWIELFNRGTTPAELSGWILDDEDNTNWSSIPTGILLEPGKLAVLHNGFFGANSSADFRTAWSVPSDALVIGIPWGSLDNTPSAIAPINENLSLRDAGGTLLDQVNYDDDGTVWPAAANGPSIYLAITAANQATIDNSLGTNWKSSVLGFDGNLSPAGSSIFNAADVGTPGRLPTGNLPPSIAADAAAVTGNEGTTISNTGTWSDPNATNVVTLTASVGSVTKNANGTWSWSLVAPDNVAATTVTITANDGAGGVRTATFTYAASNVPPTLTRNLATVSGPVLSTITNTGTYADVAADTVTLTASIGTIVNNGNGTWSWSIVPSNTVSNQTVTITASDEDGGSTNVTFLLNALDITPPTISSIILGGTTWGAPFFAGSGNGVGNVVPAGATVPNGGINRIYIQFSEPVVGFSASSFSLLGVNLANYSTISTVTYNATTRRGEIVLASASNIGDAFVGNAINIDKLRIGVASTVVDAAGNALDGNGDNVPGGLFDFRFNVLVGDADGNGSVNGGDLPIFSSAFNSSTGNANYNARGDWNADGSVNGGDLPFFASNFNKSLPTSDPIAPSFLMVGGLLETGSRSQGLTGDPIRITEGWRPKTERDIPSTIDGTVGTPSPADSLVVDDALNQLYGSVDSESQSLIDRVESSELDSSSLVTDLHSDLLWFD